MTPARRVNCRARAPRKASSDIDGSSKEKRTRVPKAGGKGGERPGRQPAVCVSRIARRKAAATSAQGNGDKTSEPDMDVGWRHAAVARLGCSIAMATRCNRREGAVAWQRQLLPVGLVGRQNVSRCAGGGGGTRTPGWRPPERKAPSYLNMDQALYMPARGALLRIYIPL
ncbi:hypothetical protein HPB48_025494 [Haemaphysalis longicornis]|uniref:Uncharacterized protein n=1 Tax=Haemaphysalis longicornis TaxID=44386 RepID=A0A9J6H9Y8_HAELO|nr:hypothetical protein HPB48_025494 [Haemaphysalis longicornis]